LKLSGNLLDLKTKTELKFFERDIVSWNDGSKEKPSIRIAKVVLGAKRVQFREFWKSHEK